MARHPLDDRFPTYRDFAPRVRVWCVTPGLPGAIHRFHDSSPFSPSGRHLAVTQLPREDRLPLPGAVAKVVSIDLATGRSRIVAETKAWDVQLGAQVQWGADDAQLFYNDLDPDSWRPYGVIVDPETGDARKLGGTVYQVSPDGLWAVSPCLKRMVHTQRGYGVVVPGGEVPVNHGLPDDDGIHLTNVASGESRMLVSLRALLEGARPAIELDRLRDHDFYTWHVKWNSRADRLLIVVKARPREARSRVGRWLGRVAKPKRATRSFLLTYDLASERTHLVISDEVWARGGHHPNWCPDGDSVLMNLAVDAHGLGIVRSRHDECGYTALHPAIRGSGHPTMHPDGRHVLTDAYPDERVAAGDGTAPIRWIDVQRGEEETLVRIQSTPPVPGPNNSLRVDLHPAWDRDFRRIAFNGCPNGTRSVYVADLGELLEAGVS